MSQLPVDNTPSTKPRSGCFLGCFGLDKYPRTHGKIDRRRKPRWFSSSSFRLKNSDAKTVPVDTAVSDKPNRNDEHGQNVTVQVLKELDEQDDPSKPVEKYCTTSGKEDPWHSRKLQGQRQPDGSGEAMNAVMRKQLSLSASFPPPRRRKSESESHGNGIKNSKQRRPQEESDQQATNRMSGGKLEPVIGLSIIMVTLFIMVVWGRLCAILCTSAWFYFIPRLRKRKNGGASLSHGHGRRSSATGHEKGWDERERETAGTWDLDLNYEEQKKRVVLEGFLERNRRSSLPN